MTKHIVVIDPAVVKPELSAFNRIVGGGRMPLTYHLPALFGTHSLKMETGGIAGIIIFGSKASVNENLEWQRELADWLRPLWAESIPTLGICYGHQLIGYLHGAKVGHAFSDKKKRAGFREVLFGTNRLFENRPKGSLYYSHEEAVLTVPEEMKPFASSAEVAVEGLEHKTRPIWSLQTHPETMCVNDGVRRHPNDLVFGHAIVDSFLLKCQNHG